MIWLIIALVVVVLVACALGLYTTVLRRRSRVQASNLTRLVKDNADLIDTIENQKKTIAIRDRTIALNNETMAIQRQVQAEAQVELRRSARLSMQAAAEVLDLRLELQQVRRRELPVLSDIRKGIPDASYRSEPARS